MHQREAYISLKSTPTALCHVQLFTHRCTSNPLSYHYLVQRLSHAASWILYRLCAVSQRSTVPYSTGIWWMSRRKFNFCAWRFTFMNIVINPRRACAVRLRYLVHKCVCLSVTTFSATTCNETTKGRYQKVELYTGFILKVTIFIKVLCSRVKAWKPSE